ncbi:MAG: beta-lactamase family protein [Parvibaculaceae bacterium]|nr:beta-lactamase family protein [Parvibaculaceae bacterium]
MLKIAGISVLVLLVIIVVAGVTFRQQIGRALYQGSLFSGAEQAKNFVRQADYYPVNRMTASDAPIPFPQGDALVLAETFSFKDENLSVEDFLTETDTVALLVLKDGKLVYENYWQTGGKDVQWLSHSVSKSFVSAAVGLALRDGLIKSLEEPISNYVPMLKDSGYNGVRIKDVLQMSSGVRWTEKYSSGTSDINRFGWTMMKGASYDEFVTTIVAETPPGTQTSYTGMDTQALTMLIRSVTGKSLAAYLQEELWQPLGMEFEAFWTTDNSGVELGLGGLNATARDFAKLGELYRLDGAWHGNQILPADWVAASTTPDAPYLQRGANKVSTHGMGYGYQWWLPKGDDQDFSAIGIYNQFIYVNPEENTVIVKLSANRNYAQNSDPSSYREVDTFALFREIARNRQQ